MKKLSFIWVSTLLIGCLAAFRTPAQTLESANAAYDQFDLSKSREILEAVLTIDTLQKKQKGEALRKLAYQDWKFYRNYALAKERLTSADSLGSEKYEAWLLLSRIEKESQHFEEALNASEKAGEFAKSENEVNQANVAYANAVYTAAVNPLSQDRKANKDLLTRATELLSRVLETDAGLPTPSKLLLGIALLNNDGENVLKAWQSYFQIQEIKNTYPYLSASAEKLSQVCENWSGRKLSISDQEVLIDALSSSRFYEFIPVYVKENNSEPSYNQNTKDAITYSRYLKEVEAATNEYYRSIAIGKKNETAYIEWLSNKRKELWNNLSFTAQREYSENEFLKETEKHFGARGFTGSTGNYSGYVLALGHIVNQEKAKVEQYGYQPEFIYTQIDMMISNGYSSWFWEYKSIGGWATATEIIRVREAYLNEPINAWKMVTDSVERQKKEEEIQAFLTSFSTNQLELSGGLAAKLKFDALLTLYDSLSSTGLSGQALKLAFLSNYEQYRMEASMLAHEGRHSIDQKYFPDEFEGWTSEIREFRGKLSQIIFAPEPRLELPGMVTGANGDYGHHKANQRIVDVAVEWIKENKEHISGYSDTKSPFAQIYLLTTDQIKDCYREADPLNRE